MKHKRKKQKEPVRQILHDLIRQPDEGFYRQPVLHISCCGQIEVENCSEILLYDENQIRLDMGCWEVALFGDSLELCAASKGRLVLKGKVFRTEFSYKEGA